MSSLVSSRLRATCAACSLRRRFRERDRRSTEVTAEQVSGPRLNGALLIANLESAASSPVGPRPRIGPELRLGRNAGATPPPGSEVANVLADRVTVAASKRSGAPALIDRAGARSSPRISSQLDGATPVARSE
jgi:hypothetical protein